MPSDPEVLAALQRSRFGGLPAALLQQLLDAAMALEVPAGTILVQPGAHGRLLVVAGGVLKTFLIAPSGRQATIRYSRPGDIVGAPTAFDNRPTNAGLRALTPARVVVLDRERVRALAASEVQVSQVFNLEMAERLYAYFAELTGTTFGSLRQRVIRHLLDVASEQQEGPTLVARLSQQELADAVGSVREVVARVLAKLREDGLVRTGDGQIELLDTGRLAEENLSGVTNVTPATDRSR